MKIEIDGETQRDEEQPGTAGVGEAVEDEIEQELDDEGVQADGVEVGEASEVEILRSEMDELQDKHLRLAAEFDNYRKRTMKELADAGVRAQAALIGRMLDALDDLGRVAALDPESTSAKDVVDGVAMVERKMLRELESAGLEQVGEPGAPFDPNDHEAMGSVPAPTPEQDNSVANVVQKGYRLGSVLIRPARVQVFMWQEPEDS